MISVIVPAFNEEKYLPALLDAVLDQTCKDFEILVVNDGSTDGTQQVIDRYCRDYPGIIRGITQQNQGLSASRNNALPLARGEYIAFLDADDIIEKDYLEKLLAAAVDQKADIVKCSYTDFDNRTGKVLGHISAAERTVDVDGKPFTFHYCAWGGLYRTAFLKDNQLLFSVGEQMEDSPFSLMANQLAERTAVVDEELYHHRIHENSILSNVKKARSDPKIPYRGFEEAVRRTPRTPFGDFCFIRALADYATERFKTQGSAVRRPLIDYIYRIMDTYFPDADKNPYIAKKILSGQPDYDYLAVRLFVQSYKLRMLYPFSALTSLILRRR